MPIDVAHIAYTTFPADPRVRRAARAGAEEGLRVAVVALRHPGERPVERTHDLLIVRLPGRRTRGSFLAYVGEYIAFTVRCRLFLSRHRQMRRIRLVHIHTLPDFLIWAAIPCARRGARVILDLHEILPEFAASKFKGAGGRIVAAVARRVEQWARHTADATITVNRPIDLLLNSRAAGGHERRIIIHNSPDPAEIGPEREPVPASTATGVPLKLVYHGTVTALYGLDIAIQGVEMATRGGIALHFTILGGGPQVLELRELIRRLDASAFVRLVPPVPASDLRRTLLKYDAGIVPTQLNGMTRYSLSNKLLEYIHLGIPTLPALLPSYTSYLSERDAWYWEPGSPESLAEAVRRFASDAPAERAARARRAQVAVRDIAWPQERPRLVALYNELLDVRSRQSRTASADRSDAAPSP